MTQHDIRKRTSTRYFLAGELITDTGLHVGSGYGSARTDATVVRDFWGRPYIPGSSFKGALRSAVERLIAGLVDSSLQSCQLIDGTSICLSTDRTRQDSFSDLAEQNPPEKALIDFLNDPAKGLCDTCMLFGSPFSQARLSVADLPLAGTAEQAAASEIRHGVGIDRDTLTARERIKFDFEALPSQLHFAVELTLDRPSALDLGLLALGLQEMALGLVPLGGIRSRGLGRCTLALQTVGRVDLSDKKAVLASLLSGKPAAGEPVDPAMFIQDHLAAFVQAA